MTNLPIGESHEMIQKTGLTISHSALSFTQTANDKPAYLLLTITQQAVNTPITFTTDDPAYFQLASDNQPYYRSTLTVVSSAPKFHVHIRYAADKRGLHTGQLTIQTPHENKVVYLEGRRKGWLPIRFGSSQEAPISVGQSKNWVLLTMLVGILGLGYMGYIHRCQLFPSLCRDATPATIVTKAPSPVLVPSGLSGSEPKAMQRSKKPQTNLTREIGSLSRLRHSLPAGEAKTESERAMVASKTQAATIRAGGRRRESARKAIDKPEERIQPKPALTSEESELEKALNKPL